VIDDDQAVAATFKSLLTRNGFVVHAVTSGREGLRWLAKEPVDLVVTDIFMDDMDGLETVTEIKKHFPQVKIIAMSGGSMVVGMDSLHMAKMLGADRTLKKPDDLPKLLEVIADLVGK